MKTLSQVLRAARAENYAIPTFKDFGEKCDRAGFQEQKWLEEDLQKPTAPTSSPWKSFFPSKPELEFTDDDVVLLVQIMKGQGAENVRLAREHQAWTSGQQDRMLLEPWRKKNLANAPGRVILCFTEYEEWKKEDNKWKTRRLFYGFAKIVTPPDITKTVKWADSCYHCSPCFGIEWISEPPINNLLALPPQIWKMNTGAIIDRLSVRTILETCCNTGNNNCNPGGKKTKKVNADEEELENDENDSSTYQGAIVIDPILGYYSVPVATLDFSSLYPSIIISFNMCWSTYITREHVPKYQFNERPKDASGRYISVSDKDGKYRPDLDGDYVITPANHMFVTKKIREGLLPRILVGLLTRRSVAKSLLSVAKDVKKQISTARERESIRPEQYEKQRPKLLAALESYETNAFVIAESERLKVKSDTIDKKEATEAVRRIIREKYSIDLATATHAQVHGAAVTLARAQVASALGKIEATVKKLEVTMTAVFDPLKIQFDSIAAPCTLDAIQTYNSLYEAYDSIESVLDSRQNALKISANSAYGYTSS